VIDVDGLEVVPEDADMIDGAADAIAANTDQQQVVSQVKFSLVLFWPSAKWHDYNFGVIL